MKSITTQFKSAIFIALTLVYSSQSRAAGNIIQYKTPNTYLFKMSTKGSKPTSCTQLKILIEKYKSNNCDKPARNIQCHNILTNIKTESQMDFESDDISKQFYKNYYVQSIADALRPSGMLSKRFDIVYADLYHFKHKDDSNYKFEGSMSEIELDIEAKSDLPSNVQFTTLNGYYVVHVASRIRACALESGRISIQGTDPVEVSGYPVLGEVALKIVDRIYKEATAISAKTGLTSIQKNYLLGIASGTALKELENQLTDAKEVQDVALSLQNVVLDLSNQMFLPSNVNTEYPIAKQLLNPGFTQYNAPIQIDFSNE